MLPVLCDLEFYPHYLSPKFQSSLIPKYIFLLPFVDNPSYFTLPSDFPARFRNVLSLRKWSEGTQQSSQTLPSSSVRRGSLTPQARRNFRSLKRTNSADTHLLILGKPRPSDLPPTYTSHPRRSSVGNVNSNDLLHQDMVHCGGLPEDSNDNDVFLSNNRNVQYYNSATLSNNRIIPSGRRRHSIGSFLQRDRPFSDTPGNENRTQQNVSTRRKMKRFSFEKGMWRWFLLYHFF